MKTYLKILLCLATLTILATSTWATQDWDQRWQTALKDNNQETLEALLAEEGASVSSRDWSPLFWAVWKGDLQQIQTLLAQSKDINQYDTKKRTNILHWAALRGHLEVVGYLVHECKIDPNIQDFKKETPLYWAVECGHLEVVKYLVHECKVNPNIQFTTNGTVLHLAAQIGRLEVVKYLVQKCSADPNICAWTQNHEYGFGINPLHLAAARGHLEVVKYLVQNCKVNPNIQDNNDQTGLSLAAQSGHLEVIKYLVKECSADPNIQDYRNRTPLHLAAARGHLEIVKYFVREYNIDPNVQGESARTPSHNAAAGGHLEVIKFLVHECKANPNIQDKYNITPLYEAAVGGHLEIVKYLVKECNVEANIHDQYNKHPLYEAAARGRLGVITYLIKECNIDPNIQGEYTGSPLHNAAAGGHLDVIKYLVQDCKANPNIQDKYKSTPLHKAAENGFLEIVTYLVNECNADPSIQDSHKIMPLQYAARNYIRKFNGFIDNNNKYEKIMLFFINQMLIKSQNTFMDLVCSDKNHAQKDSKAFEEDLKISIFILKQFKEIFREYHFLFYSLDENGDTPLKASIRQGNRLKVEALLACGLDPNRNEMPSEDYISLNRRQRFENTDYYLPLHVAAEVGNLEMMLLLIEHSADVNRKDKQGRTPLHVAIAYGNWEVALWLAQQGADIYIQNYDPKVKWYPGSEQEPLPYRSALQWAVLIDPTQALNMLLAQCVDAASAQEQVQSIQETLNPSRDSIQGDLLLFRVGQCGLHRLINAQEEDLVRSLLQAAGEREVDLQVSNAQGYYPLHLAAMKGNARIARLLLAYGADLQAEDAQGRRALDYLWEAGDAARVELLLHLEGDYALHRLISTEEENLIDLLLQTAADRERDLDYPNDEGFYPLHLAAWAGNLKLTQLFLDHGFFVDQQNDEGETPLHMASDYGHLAVVDLLLDREADPEILNQDDQTALDLAEDEAIADVLRAYMLHYAVYRNNWQRLAELVQQEDIDVDVLYRGSTALHLAARRNNIEGIETLLRLGADVTVRNQDGELPVQTARRLLQEQALRRLMLATFHTTVSDGRWVDVLRLINSPLININGLDAFGHSTLYLGAMRAQPEIVRNLLAHGVQAHGLSGYLAEYVLANNADVEAFAERLQEIVHGQHGYEPNRPTGRVFQMDAANGEALADEIHLSEEDLACGFRGLELAGRQEAAQVLINIGTGNNDLARRVRAAMANTIYDVLVGHPQQWPQEIRTLMTVAGFPEFRAILNGTFRLGEGDLEGHVDNNGNVTPGTPLWRWLTHPRVFDAFVQGYFARPITLMTFYGYDHQGNRIRGMLDALALATGTQVIIHQTTGELGRLQELYRTEEIPLNDNNQNTIDLRFIGHEGDNHQDARRVSIGHFNRLVRRPNASAIAVELNETNIELAQTDDDDSTDASPILTTAGAVLAQGASALLLYGAVHQKAFD